MNFLKIKQGALALAFVCVGIFTTGCCAGTYEVFDSQTEQELATVNLNDAKIIINQVEAGKYVSGNKTYDKSGFILTNCISNMSKQYNGGIKLYNKVLSYDDMLKEMKGTDFDYLIYASIINWEDHPTEWNLRRDHVTVQISLTDLKPGKKLPSETFHGFSSELTLGGDHPQDLLAEPLATVLAQWFKNTKLNAKSFECEDMVYKSDF